MDIIQLYQDFSLDYKTEGHKHCRTGFVNVECPLCETNNPGYHLSYNIDYNYFVCWKCGWQPIPKAISALLNIPLKEVYPLLKQYGDLPTQYIQKQKKFNTLPFQLPSNITRLKNVHKNYLIGRGFDPDKLEFEWNLFGTKLNSVIEHTDELTLRYNFRIIIPFIWNDELVTFDSRDVTGKSGIKYQACPLEREIIPHKSILYGRQDKWKESGVCVEGPTDVWRFGEHSFATSGIKFTTAQLRVISKTFKKVFVCFDANEIQASQQADLMVSELKLRGTKAYKIDLETGDPGSMGQSEADYFVKQLVR